MGWFSKKEDKENEIPSLPDLPPASNLQLPEAPPGISKSTLPSSLEPSEMELEVNSLPTLPEFKTKKEQDQKMIKQAVYPDMQKSIINSTIPPSRLIKPVKEMDPGPKTIEMPSIAIKSVTKKLEPVYVRLDKFETTVTAFEEIRNKINEIENLLAKVRETKRKEEAELEEWEKEIQVVKARIEAIDKSIFNKLD